MSFYDVLELLLDQSTWFEASALFLAMAFIYLVAFRARFRSIFDPLVYVLVLSAVSSTVLLLMAWHDAVSPGKVAFVAVTLALFYGGFLATDASRRNPPRTRTNLQAPQRIASSTLATLFVANCALLVTIYSAFGIPLLLESRLAQFAGSGGFGALSRIATGLEFPSLVLAFIGLRQHGPARKWAQLIITQFVVSAVLSGSKGSLLTGLFAWYLSAVYLHSGWAPGVKLPRFMVGFVLLALVLPIFTLFIQGREQASDLGSTLVGLAMRIAAEGDAYAYFLGGDLIDTIARHDWLAPLRQVLAAFRLVAAESAVNPGFEVIREVLSVDEPFSGPNSRLPIYLLYFYGYGGICFAPFLGAALGKMRNMMIRRTRRSPVSFALIAAMYFHLCRLEVDPQLTVGGFFGMALALPIFYLAATLGVTNEPRTRSRARRRTKRGALPLAEPAALEGPMPQTAR